jgi:hypothetical protein
MIPQIIMKIIEEKKTNHRRLMATDLFHRITPLLEENVANTDRHLQTK